MQYNISYHIKQYDIICNNTYHTAFLHLVEVADGLVDERALLAAGLDFVVIVSVILVFFCVIVYVLLFVAASLIFLLLFICLLFLVICAGCRP